GRLTWNCSRRSRGNLGDSAPIGVRWAQTPAYCGFQHNELSARIWARRNRRDAPGLEGPERVDDGGRAGIEIDDLPDRLRAGERFCGDGGDVVTAHLGPFPAEADESGARLIGERRGPEDGPIELGCLKVRIRGGLGV